MQFEPPARPEPMVFMTASVSKNRLNRRIPAQGVSGDSGDFSNRRDRSLRTWSQVTEEWNRRHGQNLRPSCVARIGVAALKKFREAWAQAVAGDAELNPLEAV